MASQEDVEVNRRLGLLAIAFVGVVGCASPAVSSSPAASATPAETIYVRIVPDPGECPLVAFPPGDMTFRIDPAALWPQQVVAIASNGTPYHVWWSEGFTGGSVADPVVRDPAGEVVARDGEILSIPDQGSPRLHGYMVCASSDSIYVLLPGRA